MGTTQFEAWGFFPNGNENNSLTVDEFSVAVIPEPSTAAAFAGLAALGLVLLRRR